MNDGYKVSKFILLLIWESFRQFLKINNKQNLSSYKITIIIIMLRRWDMGFYAMKILQ